MFYYALGIAFGFYMETTLHRMIQIIVSVLMTVLTPKEKVDALAINYIEDYKQIAIIEMHRTGIPASITMAQALHESNMGKSRLATNANNHFGIKCKSYWSGQTFYHKDDDLDKKGRLIESCFRSYDTVIDSYVDHSNFLKFGENYFNLFSLSIYDYKGWAHGLKKSGYATDKQYAEKLIKYIEKYNLNELDYAADPMKMTRVKTFN